MMKSGNMLKLQNLIEQTAEVDDVLAKGLSVLAKQYEYKTLFDLFRG
jgi:hypothetical protein